MSHFGSTPLTVQSVHMSAAHHRSGSCEYFIETSTVACHECKQNAVDGAGCLNEHL